MPAKEKKNQVKIEENKAALSADWKSTAEIEVPARLIDQVIGQESSAEIIKKAAAQKRNMLLVGLPGTGKSMLAQAMAEILPVSELHDILIYPNHADPNNPRVRTVKSGRGKEIVQKARLQSRQQDDNMRIMGMVMPIAWFILSWVSWKLMWIPDVVYAATIIGGFFLIISFALGTQMRARGEKKTPKLLVDNAGKKTSPFFEATGARAGSLLGDVRHDPLQSLCNDNKLFIIRNGVEKKISFEKLWDETVKKYPELVEKHEKGYEAIVLPATDEVFTFGFKDGKIIKSRIYSMNRHPHDGEIVDISVGKKKITLTPEHQVITDKGDKKAENISDKDSLFELSFTKSTN